MEFFTKAKTVRLRSHHDKYLVADDDQEGVTQDRSGSSRAAKWGVEIVSGSGVVRLKSCYGRYLTASNVPFLLGVTGRKVLQTLPRRLDSSVEWEPIREGVEVKLKTRYGQFLRANTGLPPWRNSVTHDIPHSSHHQDWLLWDVEVVEVRVPSPERIPPCSSSLSPAHSSAGGDAGSTAPPSSHSTSPPNHSKQESLDYIPDAVRKPDGRMIQYRVADDRGDVDDDSEPSSFLFHGSTVEQLTERLKEETGLDDIIVCTHSMLNGKLYPLRLHLPPNNAAMNVVIVPSTSRVAKSFAVPAVP